MTPSGPSFRVQKKVRKGRVEERRGEESVSWSVSWKVNSAKGAYHLCTEHSLDDWLAIFVGVCVAVCVGLSGSVGLWVPERAHVYHCGGNHYRYEVCADFILANSDTRRDTAASHLISSRLISSHLIFGDLHVNSPDGLALKRTSQHLRVVLLS